MVERAHPAEPRKPAKAGGEGGEAVAPLVFRHCVEAIQRGVLIVRESKQDKEFHFQNWFKARLEETGLNYEIGGRNSYPDFRMVHSTDGFEVKGLAYPGRDASFDSNSQVPTGLHNGRTIYYAFGRYPKEPDGDEYPVLDIVVCHGDFLNANHDYVHKNKNVKGFGTYGDIMIRDRKMYVLPTPFHLIDGAAHHLTLVMPASENPGPDFVEVGKLNRVEAPELIVGYAFDLKTNELAPRRIPNPNKGTVHSFRAWRLQGLPAGRVSLRKIDPAKVELAPEDDDET
jgi:hypothetical protein